MPSTITTVAPLTSVAVLPATKAGALYRSARAEGFPARPGLNLRNFGGRTIEHLTFTHVYLGGEAAWSRDDVDNIDWALPAAMRDPHLNNVIAQYYPDGKPTTTFEPSRFLEGPLPQHVFRNTVEGFVAGIDVTGFDLSSTVFCFLLPRGVVLVDGDESDMRFHAALRELDEAADSEHGLGGYHGSVHRRLGTKTEAVYYAVGVYNEGSNGIVVFPEPWKNICAVFYHELCEAMTDPDIEDAIRAGDSPVAEHFLGWYSPQGGEIGDIPLDQAGADLRSVIKEVPLAGDKRKVPVQLMWSNAVAGPEGPIAKKHPAL